jgi:hypothetical protein
MKNYMTWYMQLGFWMNWKESVSRLDIRDPISQPRSVKDLEEARTGISV